MKAHVNLYKVAPSGNIYGSVIAQVKMLSDTLSNGRINLLVAFREKVIVTKQTFVTLCQSKDVKSNVRMNSSPHYLYMQRLRIL